MLDWMNTSEHMYEPIKEQRWSEKQQSFVQCNGSKAVDASALIMALWEFAGPTDPRMLATIDRVQIAFPSVWRHWYWSDDLPVACPMGGNIRAESQGQVQKSSFFLTLPQSSENQISWHLS
jgi:hypothetical protein